MAIQAEVSKSGGESPLATIRKFSRRVQGAKLVKTMRARRYWVRKPSKSVKKKHALKLIKRRKDFQQLVKEGKVAETRPRGNYREREQTPRPTLGEGTPIAR